jgi:multisubunit Na+/H+ antiporter MnhG subunit
MKAPKLSYLLGTISCLVAVVIAVRNWPQTAMFAYPAIALILIALFVHLTPPSPPFDPRDLEQM